MNKKQKLAFTLLFAILLSSRFLTQIHAVDVNSWSAFESVFSLSGNQDIYIVSDVSAWENALQMTPDAINIYGASGTNIWKLTSAGSPFGAAGFDIGAGKSLHFEGNIVFDEFSEISLSGNGGVFKIDSAALSLGNLWNPSSFVFSNNFSRNDGGVIYGLNSSIDFINSYISFNSNEATTLGGVAYLDSSSLSFIKSKVVFSNNKKDSALQDNDIYMTNGSYLYIETDDISQGISFDGGIESYNAGRFHFNLAGGGVSFTKYNVFDSMSYSTISGGGIVSFYASTSVYQNSEFLAINGSTLYFNRGNIKFIQNSGAISASGGAILFESVFHPDDTRDIEVLFSSNQNVSQGGAANLTGGSFMHSSNSTVRFAANSASSDGGALYLYNAAVYSKDISYFYFSNNFAPNKGGAVFAEDGFIFDLSKTGFQFNKNTADDGAGVGLGGALYLNVSGQFNVEFSTVSFTENSAAQNGGALYAGNGINFSFNSSRSSFAFNSAQNGGGAYFENSIAATFQKTSFSFVSNSASAKGGALFVANGISLSFSESTAVFQSNSADSGAGIYAENTINLSFAFSNLLFFLNSAANGSPFYIKDGNADFSYTRAFFRLNEGVNGGSLYADNNLSFNSDNSYNLFIANSASASGGVFYLNDGNTVNFSNSTALFYSNRAADGGAIFASQNNSISFLSSSINFTSNAASNLGGALHILPTNQASFQYSTVTFSSNTALQSGGAIYIHNDSPIAFQYSDAFFVFNTAASGSGGAIVLEETDLNFENASFVFFNLNSAENKGGALYAGNSYSAPSNINFLYSSVSFRKNTAINGNGGAAYLSDLSVLNFSYSTLSVSSNSAQLGGALYAMGGSSINFAVSFALFTANTASGNGGAAQADSAFIDFSNSTLSFISNSAVEGGSIYLLSSIAGGSKGKIIFNSNSAQRGASVFIDANSKFSFDRQQMYFLNNTAENAGAGIYAAGIAEFSNSYIEFNSNKSSANGSSLYIAENAEASFNLSSVVFILNESVLGGALFLENGINLNLEDSTLTFILNTAYSSGGAVFIDNPSSLTSDIEFNKVLFLFSSNAAQYGGALSMSNASRNKITNSTLSFIFNTASTAGAAVFADNSSILSFENSSLSFTGNLTMASSGGAFLIQNNSALSFTSSTILFLKNSAISSESFGAAIYAVNSASVKFSSAAIVFTSHTALSGAVFYAGNSSQISFDFSTVSFLYNTAVSSGAIAAILDAADFSFNGGILFFLGNTSMHSKGIFYLENLGALSFINIPQMRVSSNAAISGGFLSLEDNVSEIDNVGEFSFTENSAFSAEQGLGFGGVFALSGSTISISGSGIFASNLSLSSGGFLYALNSSASIIALSSPISARKNKAGGSVGNDIYLENSYLFLNPQNSTINFEDGGLYGISKSAVEITGNGALLLSGYNYFSDLASFNVEALNYFEITKATFSFRDGGQGLSIKNSTVAFKFSSFTFSSNTAQSAAVAAALHLEDVYMVSFSSVRVFLVSNTAFDNTSAVLLIKNSTAIFSGSTFSFSLNEYNFAVENSSITSFRSSFVFTNNASPATASDGGALKIKTSTASFNYASVFFSGNNASQDGGGIYIEDAYLEGRNSTFIFINNTAGRNGTFYLGGSVSIASFTKSRLSFSSNTAQLGSAFYMPAQTQFYLYNSLISFTSNTSLQATEGGTIFADASLINLVNSSASFLFNSAQNGGAVYAANYSSAIFQNSTVSFYGNTAQDKGGALSFDNSLIEFSSSRVSFTSNTALGAGMGGAVNISANSLINIFNSSALFSFSNADKGGAIYLSASTINFVKTTASFVSNTAQTTGGALYADGSFVNFTTGALKFSQNTAVDGGGLYSNNSQIKASEVKFDFLLNTASNNGAGVYFVDKQISLTSSAASFSSNTAYQNGGGVFIGKNLSETTASFTASKLDFIRNSAVKGGAVFADGASFITSASVSNFLSNKADLGGAFYLSNLSYLVIDGTANFTNNSANSDGGAIYAESGSIISLNASGDIIFRNNKALSDLGSDLYSDGATLQMSGSQNKQIRFEDGVYAVNSSLVSITSISVYFSSRNYFDALSSFAASDSKSLSFENSSVSYLNSSAAQILRSNVLFKDSAVKFSGNSSISNGGAFYLEQSTASFTNNSIKTVEFSNNASDGEGGAFYVLNSTLIFSAVSDIVFSANSASGGNARNNLNDLYLSGSKLSFNIQTASVKAESGIYLENNSLLNFTNAKSAVLIVSNEFSLKNSTAIFQNNTASASGAVLTLTNASALSFDNSFAYFSGNKANYGYIGNVYSASLYLDGTILAAQNSTLTFTANTAGNPSSFGNSGGGAIYAANVSSLSFDLSLIKFISNMTNFGGGIYLKDGSADFQNSEVLFQTNYARSQGGGLFLENSIITFNNSTVSFLRNTASQGGAIYAANSSVTINADAENVSFIGNSAVSGGDIYLENSYFALFAGDGKKAVFDGGIYAVDGSIIKITGPGSAQIAASSRFENSASFEIQGASVSFSNGDASYSSNSSPLTAMLSTVIYNNMQNVSYSGNDNASGDGGGLKISNSLVSINAVLRFDGNRASGKGGAVYIENSSLSFTGNAVFLNNSAGGEGGAIYSNASTVSFFAESGDILFSGNGNSDIYLDNGGNFLNFNATSGKKIEFNSGILALTGASGDKITKTGEGSFIMRGDIKFEGEISHNKGNFIFYGSKLEAGILNINSASFRTVDENLKNPSNRNFRRVARLSLIPTVSVASISVFDLNAVKASLVLGLYFNSNSAEIDKIYASNQINLSDISLSIEGYGSINSISAGISEIEIMTAQNGIQMSGYFDGSFIWYLDSGDIRKLPVSFSLDSTGNSLNMHISSSMSLNIQGLTKNQEEVEGLLNKISNNQSLIQTRSALNLLPNSAIKRALDEMSGVFLLNALFLSAQNNSGNFLHNRMALKRFSEFEKKINIWADYYLGVSSVEGEESQGEKVKSNKSGFQAGFDIFSNEKFILGVYGGQSEISVKQNKDSADFTSVEAGAYGSVFAEMFSLFFNLGGNLYSVDAVRNLASTGDKNKSSFVANLIKGGIEAEFGHNGGQQAALKPFAAIEGSYLMSETIKEKGSDSALIIDESSFMRIDGKGGFKIGIQSGSFQLYTKAYLGYIFTGAGFDADISFAAEPKAGKMSISKTPEDNFFLGGSFGGKWMPFDSFKFFADISLDSMGGNVNYLMQAGIEMSFGVKKTEAEKEAIREAARLKKEQKTQEKQAKDEEKKRLQDAAQAEDSKAQEIERLQALLAEAEEKARQAEIASEPPFRTENIQETNSLADAVEDAKLRRKNPNVKSFRLSAASFKSASAVLTDQAKRDIAVLAQGMQNYNYNSIIVEGHADSSGGEIRNMELSQLRARAVFDELSKLGVRNINYIGLGSAFPIASNKTPAGRQQNRRVEVFVE